MRIATRSASAAVKKMVYNLFVLPRIGYDAPHLTSSLDEMRVKLDKPAQKLLRRISNNMTSFPTKLLHLPSKMAGLGLKCPTGIFATTTKITYPQSATPIGRCSQHSGGATKETAETQTTTVG